MLTWKSWKVKRESYWISEYLKKDKANRKIRSYFHYSVDPANQMRINIYNFHRVDQHKLRGFHTEFDVYMLRL